MERVILSKEDAIAMLPDGDNVHTFRSGAFSLIGADWDKESILELINEILGVDNM